MDVVDSPGAALFFDPSYSRPGWRELVVEVSPLGVTGYWGSKQMRILTGDRFVQFTNEYLDGIRKSKPEDPFGRGLNPAYAPRGGLGLYVRNGSAAFRRVVIEPLDE